MSYSHAIPAVLCRVEQLLTEVMALISNPPERITRGLFRKTTPVWASTDFNGGFMMVTLTTTTTTYQQRYKVVVKPHKHHDQWTHHLPVGISPLSSRIPAAVTR